MGTLRGITIVLFSGLMWVVGAVFNAEATPLMVEKNLFAQERKPVSGDASAPSAQKNKSNITAKMIQLDGVFISGSSKKAILRFKGQVPGAEKGKPQSPFVTVTEGEKVGDFQVTKIDYRSISVEKDGEVSEIGLFAEGKVLPPMASAPAAASPTPDQGAPSGQQGNVKTPQMPPQQPGRPQVPGGPPSQQAVRQGGGAHRQMPAAPNVGQADEDQPEEEEEFTEDNAEPGEGE